MSMAMPTMTSMYAQPGASLYMPAGNVTTATVAAPAASYVSAPRSFAPVMQAAPIMQAPVTTAAPSFVAPQVSQFSQYGVANSGLVDPKTLESERIAYEKALAAQLGKQSEAVIQEAEIKKKMLAQTRDTQVAQMALQLEEQLKMATLQVDKQAADTLTGLKEAAVQQSTAVGERVALGIEEYKKKAAMEQMAQKSYQLQKQWYDHEAKLMADYQRVARSGAKNVITPAAPQVPMAAPVSTAVAAPAYAAPAYAAPVTTAVAAPQVTTAVAAPRTTAVATPYAGASYGVAPGGVW